MSFDGATILWLWGRLAAWPGGRWLFSVLAGWLVPYTGTVAPRILELEAGFARVAMADRRRVRNHLRSVHAIALANLAEFTGSLAIASRVPSHSRWIVTGLRLEYLKKARGPLEARCEFRQVALPAEGTAEAETRIFDAAGVEVCRARVELRLGPRPGA